MTDVLEPGTKPDEVAAGLRDYVLAVAGTLGLGAESCAINPRWPASGYIAVNVRLARFPGCDLALCWDELSGWSATVEADFGESVTTIARLAGDVLPDPARVQAFVDDLVAESAVHELRPHAVIRRLRGHTAA